MNYSYGWISSENGTHVNNAVTLNNPKNSAQYIGRVEVNGIFFLGAVVRILGGMYFADSSGVEQFTTKYEVLVCNKSIATTIAAPQPICREYNKILFSKKILKYRKLFQQFIGEVFHRKLQFYLHQLHHLLLYIQ